MWKPSKSSSRGKHKVQPPEKEFYGSAPKGASQNFPAEWFPLDRKALKLLETLFVCHQNGLPKKFPVEDLRASESHVEKLPRFFRDRNIFPDLPASSRGSWQCAQLAMNDPGRVGMSRLGIPLRMNWKGIPERKPLVGLLRVIPSSAENQEEKMEGWPIRMHPNRYHGMSTRSSSK